MPKETEFRIEMMGRSAQLDRIELPAPIAAEVLPIRDAIRGKLSGAEFDDLAVVFVLDEDRRLSIEFRGEATDVHQAVDRIGSELEVTAVPN